MARNMGCTVLLVTHDNRILDVADRLIKIEDGSMEDSHIGMQRLIHQLVGLASRLSHYMDDVVCQHEDASVHLEVLRSRFTEEAEELNGRMLNMIEGRLNPAMHERARMLQNLLGHLFAMEASLVSFVKQLWMDAGKETPGLPDRFAQSIQFLLLTAEDAFRSQAAEDLALLHSLTEDRGETM